MAERVEYVLAVDGGNSKTDLVIASSRGDVIAELRGPGTRSHEVGISAMVSDLADLVAQGRDAAGLSPDEDIAVGSFFIANLDVPESETQAFDDIAARGLSRQIQVRNDTLAPLRAGAPEGWGIAVVSGAGINAVGVHPDGREERFLALGEVTGDWGGGAGVGLAGLGAAVRAGDGRGPRTILRDLVGPALGFTDPEQLALALSEGRLHIDALHDLAPVVFAAVETGDPVACSISLRLADEVFTLVSALIHRLGLETDATPVVLAGGTLQFGPDFLLAAIRDRIARAFPLAQTRVLDVRPVAGAVLSGLDLISHDDAAEERIRAALASAHVTSR